jgi:hypothetical protein
MDATKEYAMQHSTHRATFVWRLVFIALGAVFIFLVLFSPISAVCVGPGGSVPHSEPRLSTTIRIDLPVVFNNLSASLPRPGTLLITEVLYNPAGREPEGEWVELFNAGGSAIDLSGYKIGDQILPGCCEGMLAFPAGAVLKPGEVIIIAYKATAFEGVYKFKPDYEMENSDPAVPVLTRYTAWAERGIELTNTGDDLLILGPADQIIDAVSWGSSKFAFDPPVPNVLEGYSLERYPPYIDTNTALDWRKQAVPQPGEVDLTLPTTTPGPIPLNTATPPATPTLTPTPFSGKLLLSEFLYDPIEKEPDEEWIEIYNAGMEPLRIQDFKLGDEEKRGDGEGMLRFPLGEPLQPGHTRVIAHDGAAFLDKYGFLPDYELSNSLPDLPDMLPYSGWGTVALSLHNQGDELLILDGRDDIIDSLSYGDSSFFFSPSIPLSDPGCSLERYPGNQDHHSASDWRQQCQPSPGQPALPTQPPPTPVPLLVINEIHHAPHPSFGDANGDGVISLYDDEFVEIFNITGVAVNLEGWCLADGLVCRHEFPSPSWIPNECSLVVFGYGEPTGNFGGSLVQVSSKHVLSLNDSGDTLSLVDTGGTLVLSLTYSSGGVTGESLVRYPEMSAGEFIPHTSALEAAGARFSPGTRLDGSPFPGCLFGE